MSSIVNEIGSPPSASPIAIRRIEQYLIFDTIASGGMASVHMALAQGALGFSRVVAVKQLHPHFASNAGVVGMLVDEARLMSRIRNIHVVPILDVIERDGEVFVIMEYVRGAPLDFLIAEHRRSGNLVPVEIAVAVIGGALRGLHAAHETADWDGRPLEVVHRDFTPQNILVGVGGVPRVIDFGVAKAMGRAEITASGEFRGKLAYASPEALRGDAINRRTDLFAAGTIIWELLTGERLFHGETDPETFDNVVRRRIPNPREFGAGEGGNRGTAELASVVMKALERDPELRPASALEMANHLESACLPARAPEVARWVEHLASERLARETVLMARIERHVSGLAPLLTPAPPRAASTPAPAKAVAREAEPTPVIPAERMSAFLSLGSRGRPAAAEQSWRDRRFSLMALAAVAFAAALGAGLAVAAAAAMMSGH